MISSLETPPLNDLASRQPPSSVILSGTSKECDQPSSVGLGCVCGSPRQPRCRGRGRSRAAAPLLALCWSLALLSRQGPTEAFAHTPKGAPRSHSFPDRSAAGPFGLPLRGLRGGADATATSVSPSASTPSAAALRASATRRNVMAHPNPRDYAEESGAYDSSDATDFGDDEVNGVADVPLTSADDPARDISTCYIAETNLPTDVGQFRLRAYRIADDEFTSDKANRFVGTEPCVIYAANRPPFGSTDGTTKSVPIRIHDQCFTSEVFRSQRCDCKEQLKMSLEYINENGGAIIYLQQEGRGIGLANKVAAYALQDVGMDTVDANIHLGFPEDCRQYGVVPSILKDMGIDSIRLITNNPRKVSRLRALDVNVEGTIPMVVDQATPYNRKYLETKRERMDHQNFDLLLAKKPANGSSNGVMAPQKTGVAPMAEDFINEGEEMAANAIASALVDIDPEDAAGVTAADDGYCFGRESVEKAIIAIGNGELVVVVDDMDRENEGDFIMAADLCTPQTMATIVRYSSGVICVGMEGERMDELELPAMVSNNEDPKETAFSVTVDATENHGITTGISAADRAKTMQILASPDAGPTDLVRPGHIFPLRARPGGTIERGGHTEAAVDLCKLAGRAPAGVLCELVSEEDPVSMARLPELVRFCKKHGYVLTSIVDIAQYRRDVEGGQ